jgi:hypothetical protein
MPCRSKRCAGHRAPTRRRRVQAPKSPEIRSGPQPAAVAALQRSGELQTGPPAHRDECMAGAPSRTVLPAARRTDGSQRTRRTAVTATGGIWHGECKDVRPLPPTPEALPPPTKDIDMAKRTPDQSQLNELLYQALQTEQGGIKVYETAITCAVNDDLRKEWQDYLDETRTHQEILLGVFAELGLDPDADSPGRQVVAHIGRSLVKAMEMALAAGDPAAAELVAGECVVHAETKDHMNWELIGLVAEKTSGPHVAILKAAHEEVEKEEDHHLYHTTGWTRELWIQSLGLPAVLPPPEEVKNVETAIGAARAEKARDGMIKRKH